ncbi:MAG: DUF1343 domain-containing protein, partial [Prevotellaceae bacterium]|nr:DUF1343 domain-containing protein [Prevotellaceae bacterium]
MQPKLLFVFLFAGMSVIACEHSPAPKTVVTGAEQTGVYLPLLAGKKVGVMGNQTSVAGGKHIVDVLLENKVDVKFVFALEHGFRGTIERGEEVNNEIDAKTGLPVYKLYRGNAAADSIV